MSRAGEATESSLYLSWRRLHLSKAKLKAAGNTSALLAGFAMVAMVEIQLTGSNDSECKSMEEGGCVTVLPQGLLITFAACTTLLVSVHMLALLISTCILPHMEAVASLHVPSLVNESPHEKMRVCIEIAWACSTVFGILLFMLEIVVICWVQFYHVSITAARIATAILIPFIVVFILFAVNFYHRLVGHTYEIRQLGIRELERFHDELEMDRLKPQQSLLNSNVV